MEVRTAQATPPQLLHSCPQSTARGHGLSTMEKQTLEAPRPASSLPTSPHGQGLSSGQPLCATWHHQRRLHHAAAAAVRKLKAQLESSGIFCQGKHLWSAWCPQDADTLGPGQRPCPPAKAEVASESKWKFYQHSCETGAQAPSTHGARRSSSIPLEARMLAPLAGIC